VVVGSGPNGLAAAITLARKGLRVLLLEANNYLGGAAASLQLTLPGFTHDLGAAVLPLAFASPFFIGVPLRDLGAEWVYPDVPLAHPLGPREVVLLHESIQETAMQFGDDGARYSRLIGSLVSEWPSLARDLLAPAIKIPRKLSYIRFGVHGLLPFSVLADALFSTSHARTLLAGIAAHWAMPLTRPLTSVPILLLCTLAHITKWPMVRGGTGRLIEAMAAYFRNLGGVVELSAPVRSLSDIPSARAVLFDLAPRQIVDILGDRLPSRYRRACTRYRHGPGVLKLDWALSAPIPWMSEACRSAGTIHLGGTFEEIATAERSVWEGRIPSRPFVILNQPSVFDPSRCPKGFHTAWAYCHVPPSISGQEARSLADTIEGMIEEFAPGFRDTIASRSILAPGEIETMDQNLIGGDLTGGVLDLWQVLARPVLSHVPYKIPVRGMYICSSSTPPGPGVHGMCGYWAARSALRYTFHME